MILDIVVYWGVSEGADADGGARMANGRARWKIRRYKRAMWARDVEGRSPEEAAEWAEVEVDDEGEDSAEIRDYNGRHRFVPLAFEGFGAWGESTLRFFEEVCNAAKEKASADRYHWSAMEFGVHFQQRLGLTLARGQAELVVTAAEDRRANGKTKDKCRTAVHDFHQDCCPPCASR